MLCSTLVIINIIFKKDTPREKYLDARFVSYDNVSHDHKEFYSQKAHLHANFLDEAEVIPVNNKLLFYKKKQTAPNENYINTKFIY